MTEPASGFCSLPTEYIERRCTSIVREQVRYHEKIEELQRELDALRAEMDAHRTYLSGVKRGHCWYSDEPEEPTS